ncbi:MAG: DedA family protein [Syntrophales bacterium]|nr:DedA family protein [Syntrophales bacterium]
MESSLASYGYFGLFVLSFLASTLLPVGSEWLLILMLLKGNDPLATVSIATIGNYLGSCTTWAIGIWGGPLLVRRILRIDPATEEAAVRFYRRYGVWSLLLSWMPIIGDPICLVGGILKVDFTRFSLLVFTGKLVRYAVVSWLTLGGMWIL